MSAELRDELDGLRDQVREMFVGIAHALCDGSWTCTEAEVIYETMIEVGQLEREAESFMLCHAESDDDEHDLHRVTAPLQWGYTEDES